MIYQGLALTEMEGKFYFQDFKLAETHDEKSGNTNKYNSFLQKYNLVERTSKIPSMDHLLRGCKAGPGQRHNYDDLLAYPLAIGWFAHSKILYHEQTKSYVITTQPYSLNLEKFQALEQFCQERDLTCRINYDEAWWYPGKTPLIVVCRKEVMSEIFG